MAPQTVTLEDLFFSFTEGDGAAPPPPAAPPSTGHDAPAPEPAR